MTRQPRKLSETGTYHVVFRGVNHCHLFEESEDYGSFLTRLSIVKEDLSLKVFAFCLMSNHVHLLIREGNPGDIVLSMKKLLGPYASWFNKKYQRSGALFANRYKSECVEDDVYLLTVVRYIHQNPLVAALVKDIRTYRWSSYGDYLMPKHDLVDTNFVLSMFDDDLSKATELFAKHHETLETQDHSLPHTASRSESEIRQGIVAVLEGAEPNSLGKMPKQERDVLLSLLRREGFSIRQIERATGVSRGVIARCKP